MFNETKKVFLKIILVAWWNEKNQKKCFDRQMSIL
jgi:hypothetical protein